MTEAEREAAMRVISRVIRDTMYAEKHTDEAAELVLAALLDGGHVVLRSTARCPMCGDGGWTLDSRPYQEPQCLELIPCIYPTCTESGKPVASLAIKGPRFTNVARHPVDNSVMSLSMTTNESRWPPPRSQWAALGYMPGDPNPLWCHECNGEGITDEVECESCGGSGMRNAPSVPEGPEFGGVLR